MAYFGEIFSYLIDASKENMANTKSVGSKERLPLRAWGDLPKANSVTSSKELQYFDMLREEAKNVAGVAFKNTRESDDIDHMKRNAVKGRWFHRTLGSYFWIELVNHDPQADFNNSRPRNILHGTILTPEGNILIPNSVEVYERNYPLDTVNERAKSMRRTGRVDEMTPENMTLSVHFHLNNLVNFVIANSLEVPETKE